MACTTQGDHVMRMIQQVQCQAQDSTQSTTEAAAANTLVQVTGCDWLKKAAAVQYAARSSSVENKHIQLMYRAPATTASPPNISQAKHVFKLLKCSDSSLSSSPQQVWCYSKPLSIDRPQQWPCTC
jgi:hypothetical protein